MQLATVMILPKRDNNQQDITHLHVDILNKILIHAGGYTLSDVRGAWRDGATTYLDSSLKVEVMVNNVQTLKKMRDIATEACKILSQECVYFATQHIDCEFVTLDKEEIAA